MFEDPVFPRATLSVVYPIQASLSGNLQEIANITSGLYFPPQVVTGDGGNAILLVSEHGHSQIVASPTELTLQVDYSNEWLRSLSKAAEYLEKRIPLLFQLLENILPIGKPLYGSATTFARLDFSKKRVSVPMVAKSVGLLDADYIRDITLRATYVPNEMCYLNMTTQTVRTWNTAAAAIPFVRLPDSASEGAAVEITSEVNSRRAHNESISLNVDEAHLRELIMLSQSFTLEKCESLAKGETWSPQ